MLLVAIASTAVMLYALQTIDKEDCLLCVCMVWMTLTMAKSTRRWSTGMSWAVNLVARDKRSVS